MNILAIADQESRSLWDYYEPSKLEGVDLILSCGDLSPKYLLFLGTFSPAPILYVHGNHDDCYAAEPPVNCICVEDRLYVHKGVRILGLGGSMRYKPGTNQYTQRQMDWRVRKLWFQLQRYGGFDILLTHSPAYQLGDGQDLPHTGFRAFNALLERHSPRYFVHGHTHMTYGRSYQRRSSYRDTQIINAFERYRFEY